MEGLTGQSLVNGFLIIIASIYIATSLFKAKSKWTKLASVVLMLVFLLQVILLNHPIFQLSLESLLVQRMLALFYLPLAISFFAWAYVQAHYHFNFKAVHTKFLQHSLGTVAGTLLLLLVPESRALFPYAMIFSFVYSIVLCEQLLRDDRSSRIEKSSAVVLILLSALGLIGFTNEALTIFNKSLVHLAWLDSLSISMIILCIARVTFTDNERKRTIKLSPALLSFNTSLTLIGGYLVFTAVFYQLMSAFSLSLHTSTQLVIGFAACVLIAMVALHENTKRRWKAWLTTHFFASKFDFKERWYRLDKALNYPKSNNPYVNALYGAEAALESDSGYFWQYDNHVLSRDYHIHSASNERLILDLTQLSPEEHFELPDNDWVITHAEVTEAQRNAMALGDDFWLFIPVTFYNTLLGYLQLNRRGPKQHVDHEDLDLIKLTASQIASYISNELKTKRELETKQFELFNQNTAFAIHDIKNIIAQQSLLVKNYEKHKHNPAFLDDLIATVKHCVTKMDGIQNKIANASQVKHCAAMSVLNDALRFMSLPEVSTPLKDDTVLIDADVLQSAITNVIKNALEAGALAQHIECHVKSTDHYFDIIISNQGHGFEHGMNCDNAFTPFKTSKAGQGFGIGLYQIKRSLEQYQGKIVISSDENTGTEVILRVKKHPNSTFNIAS